MLPSTTNHWLGLLGFAGLAIFMACFLALHALQPELSPRDVAMSYYVHGAYGWLTSIGLVAIGSGSLAMTIAFTRSTHDWRGWLGVAFLGLWSVGSILGGIFSADPQGNWDQPPSVAGMIHGLAAMVGLAAFPLATVALLPAFRQDHHWRRLFPLLTALTLIVVLSYVAFMASLVPVFIRPGPPVLFGLTERILLAAYVAWLALVAVGLFRTDGVLPTAQDQS